MSTKKAATPKRGVAPGKGKPRKAPGKTAPRKRPTKREMEHTKNVTATALVNATPTAPVSKYPVPKLGADMPNMGTPPVKKSITQIRAEAKAAEKAAAIEKLKTSVVAQAPRKRIGIDIHRGTLYSADVMAAICGRLAGGESLAKICDDEAMPSLTTVFRWLGDMNDATKDAFRVAYARARDVWIQRMADETLEIADTQQMGLIEKVGPNGPELAVEDMLGHRTLQVNTRKWLLSKLAPGKYGEKVIHEGGEKPIEHEVKASALDAMGARLDRFLAQSAGG